MARPRVFISSTHYDLKHLRSSLENFINSLAFDSILSEKGNIAYAPDTTLDESCYREVRNADIFVIIIGGRYGSERSEGKANLTKEFFDRYDSITKQEYKSAVEQDIPIYILIEKPVYAEYETYLRNKTSKEIVYAHVDSINIFHLIEEILAQPRNNPIQQFDRYGDIESWLKEQWAGLFRDLLTRLTSQQQISSLASQVQELAEINKTLKTYLEEVMTKVAPNKSGQLIKTESERLREARLVARLRENQFARWIYIDGKIPYEKTYEVITTTRSVDDFLEKIESLIEVEDFKKRFQEALSNYRGAVVRDVSRLRAMIEQKDATIAEEGSALKTIPGKRRSPAKKASAAKKGSAKKGSAKKR